MQEQHYLVPKHDKGTKKDLAHLVNQDSVDDAVDWFVIAKDRLLDINNWGKYIAGPLLSFHLTDAHSKDVNRHHARKGDFIRITKEASVHWLLIDAIEYDDYPDIDIESFALHVKTCSGPLQKAIGNAGTTGTFVIDRKGKHLIANYHGRVETANDDSAALGGDTWLDIPFEQWHNLIKSFILAAVIKQV